MGKFINKKEDNVLHGKFPNTQESAQGVSMEEVYKDNLVPLRKEASQDHSKGVKHSPKELLVNYGAVACVLMIMGGATVFNLNNADESVTSNRGLASVKNSFKPQPEMDERIVDDLKDGRLKLKKSGRPLNHQDFLEEVEYFQYEVLNDAYYISFDAVDGFVREVQLKSNAQPISMGDAMEFIDLYGAILPHYDVIMIKQSRNFNELIHMNEEVYILEGSNQTMSLYTDNEGQLISFIIDEI